MIQRLLRWYLYARRGLGHVGAVLSGVTFVNTVYLVSREWAIFKDLGYLEIMLAGFLCLVPLLVYVGFLDYKRGFYHVEASLATEENPYQKDAFTEKEKDYLLPVSLGVASLLLAMNDPMKGKRSDEVFYAYVQLEEAYCKLKEKLDA